MLGHCKPILPANVYICVYIWDKYLIYTYFVFCESKVIIHEQMSIFCLPDINQVENSVRKDVIFLRIFILINGLRIPFTFISVSGTFICKKEKSINNEAEITSAQPKTRNCPVKT